jgi:hypothetical protein
MLTKKKKKKTLTFSTIKGFVSRVFPYPTHYTKDGYTPPEFSLTIRPFRREFEEVITLYEDDHVEHDDSVGMLTVTRRDGSVDKYPYKLIYEEGRRSGR